MVAGPDARCRLRSARGKTESRCATAGPAETVPTRTVLYRPQGMALFSDRHSGVQRSLICSASCSTHEPRIPKHSSTTIHVSGELVAAGSLLARDAEGGASIRRSAASQAAV